MKFKHIDLGVEISLEELKRMKEAAKDHIVFGNTSFDQSTQEYKVEKHEFKVGDIPFSDVWG